MATVAMPQAAPSLDTQPAASEPWRQEESDRFYAELDKLPLPFGNAGNEQPDKWAMLTSALPHRSQREVVAFAHAEYHRMYTDPKHAQLLQDFPLGLWSTQDDSDFEAALSSGAEAEAGAEAGAGAGTLEVLAKCLPHKSAAAIEEQVSLLKEDCLAPS